LESYVPYILILLFTGFLWLVAPIFGWIIAGIIAYKVLELLFIYTTGLIILPAQIIFLFKYNPAKWYGDHGPWENLILQPWAWAFSIMLWTMPMWPTWWNMWTGHQYEAKRPATASRLLLALRRLLRGRRTRNGTRVSR
jgi:hypothetical protein